MAKVYREKDYEKYAHSIQKAINNQECAIKQKHIRSAIIGTFETQSPKIFWVYALRTPYLENRFVAWKLCLVVHRVLREGHPLCLEDSQKHAKELTDMRAFWNHLNDDYCEMIGLYASLLINKLHFHNIYPRFPGDLTVTSEEFNSIVGSDINKAFDMAIEIMNYLDQILDLQEGVFSTISLTRYTLITTTEECRLAPIIICIEESSKLYEYSARLLDILHSKLQPDILIEAKGRFMTQFTALKTFFEYCNEIPYFTNSVSIPLLPKDPPEFTVKDVSEYVNEQASAPPIIEYENEPIYEAILVDTETNDENNTNLPLQATEYDEKEFLMAECENLRRQIDILNSKYYRDTSLLKDKISILENDLALKESELKNEKQEKENLLKRIQEDAETQDSKSLIHEEMDKLCLKIHDNNKQEGRRTKSTKKNLRVSFNIPENN
ncbi:huntingtin-interacting protein 1-like [Rhynchophorus ferrugineus]|uniref:huntingtin-interacting protein 1-like n=1 Tax=Rhynchophorus ferrugineus TaxID=354439 RepID=UPI003FCCB486